MKTTTVQTKLNAMALDCDMPIGLIRHAQRSRQLRAAPKLATVRAR